jgi:hypothetical protein
MWPQIRRWQKWSSLGLSAMPRLIGGDGMTSVEEPSGQGYRDEGGDAATVNHLVSYPPDRPWGQGGESGYERRKHKNNGNQQEDHVSH